MENCKCREKIVSSWLNLKLLIQLLKVISIELTRAYILCDTWITHLIRSLKKNKSIKIEKYIKNILIAFAKKLFLKMFYREMVKQLT